jgi:hypothetical protein
MTQHKRMVQTRKCAALAFTGERDADHLALLSRLVYSSGFIHSKSTMASFHLGPIDRTSTLTYVITYRCQGCVAISMTFLFLSGPFAE